MSVEIKVLLTSCPNSCAFYDHQVSSRHRREMLLDVFIQRPPWQPLASKRNTPWINIRAISSMTEDRQRSPSSLYFFARPCTVTFRLLPFVPSPRLFVPMTELEGKGYFITRMLPLLVSCYILAMLTQLCVFFLLQLRNIAKNLEGILLTSRTACMKISFTYRTSQAVKPISARVRHRVGCQLSRKRYVRLESPKKRGP